MCRYFIVVDYCDYRVHAPAFLLDSVLQYEAVYRFNLTCADGLGI